MELEYKEVLDFFVQYNGWTKLASAICMLQSENDMAATRIAELEHRLAAAQEREKAFRIGLARARDLLSDIGNTAEAQELESLLARFPVDYSLEANHEK